MNSFGLGLVLDFVDNASAGMNSATSVFNQMSLAADSLSSSSAGGLIAAQQLGSSMGMLGNNFIDAGSGILNTFGAIAGKVVSTGSDFESFRITLNAMYGDARKTEQQISKLVDFAAKSPFEVADVKDLLITLKSQGIDAFEQMKGSTSGVRQETLAWIGDLMAFKPDIPVQRWKLALQNYIGSGESKILRNVLDMGDIENVIGHGISETVEGRMNDIIEIVEKANIQGLMTNLFGTWQQSLSNFEDQITKVFLNIADSGAYETLKSSLVTLTSVLSDMTDVELKNFAKVMADAFNMITVPLKMVAEAVAKLLKSFINLTMEHPRIAKVVTVLAGLASVGLILGGVVLTLSGKFLILASSIKYLGGLSVIFKVLSVGLSSVLSFALPLIGVSYLIYQAWSKNIGGVADLIKNTLGNAITTISLTIDAFFGNDLSEERWERASKLGLLPFIEKILMLKYHVQQTFSAINTVVVKSLEYLTGKLPQLGEKLKTGLFGAFSFIKESLVNIFGDLDWGKIAGLFATGLLIAFNPGMLKAILLPLGSMFLGGFLNIFKALPAKLVVLFSVIKNALAPIISKVGAFITPLIAGFITPLLGKITSILSILGGKLMSLLGVLVAPLITAFGGLFSRVAPFVMRGFTLLFSALSRIPIVGLVLKPLAILGKTIAVGIATSIGTVPALIAGAVIAGISVLVALITNNQDKIKNAFTAIWNKLPEPVQEVLTKVKNKVAETINFLIDKFGLRPVIDKVKSALPSIIQWFSNVGNQVMSIIGKLISWVKTAWDGWLGDLVGNIVGFVGRVVTIVSGLVATVVPIVLDFINQIIDVVTPIVDAIGEVVNSIMGILNNILDFIVNVFTGKWSSAWDNVKGIFTGVWNSLKGIAKGALNGIIGGVNTVISGLNLLKIPGTDIGVNIPKIPALSTGGYIKNEGISYLHPNEVVVNSPMTKALGNFLNDYEDGNNKNPVQHVTPNYGRQVQEYEETYIEVPDYPTIPRFNNPQSQGAAHIDNSVTFNQGSIVIQVQSTSDEDLTKAADKLMKMMARKVQLQQMAVRK